MRSWSFCLFLGLVSSTECQPNDLDLLQRKIDVGSNRKTKPNLLFVILDQWRWDWAGFHGAPALPAVERLAQRGVHFTRAYTPSPQCAPARSAIAAVREYKHMWVKNNSFEYRDAPDVKDEITPTFMKVLQQAGYTTMLAGKDHLTMGNLSGPSQAEGMALLGFEHFRRAVDKYSTCGDPSIGPQCAYGDDLNTLGLFQSHCVDYGMLGFPDEHVDGQCCNETPVFDWFAPAENGFRCTKPSAWDEEYSPDRWVRKQAQGFLHLHRQKNVETPWFLQVNFLGPHPPFILSNSTMSQLSSLPKLPDAIDADFEYQPVFDRDLKRHANVSRKDFLFTNVTDSRLQYAGLLLQIDREIQALLETVEQMPGETFIAITGDHGEHLGDHGQFGKTSPFEPAVHVPLIIAGGQRQNVKEHHPVSIIDVPMTFLELAGAIPPPTMEGYSLLPALTGIGQLTRPAVMTGMDYWEMLEEEEQNYTHGRIHFDSAAALFGQDFLKLICCPVGCLKGGSLLPLTTPAPQVALMNVTAGKGVHTFEKDVLNQPPGHGVAEALHLVQFLGEEFQKVCLPLLEAIAV